MNIKEYVLIFRLLLPLLIMVVFYVLSNNFCSKFTCWSFRYFFFDTLRILILYAIFLYGVMLGHSINQASLLLGNPRF